MRKSFLQRKTGLNKRSKTEKAKAIAKLDAAFSKMVRERDRGVCITCGKIIEGSKYHAGHFRRRELMSTRWHPKNVNGQCSADNVFRGGLPYEYGLSLDRRYGDGTAKMLHDLSREQKQWEVKHLLSLVEAAKMGWRVYEQVYYELTKKK